MLYDDLVPCGGYICHHGIKGQQWGVKNGPPYPLGTSQKSPKEKRYRVSRIKSNLDETTNSFKKAYNKVVNKKTKDGRFSEYEWLVEDLNDELSFYEDVPLIDRGKNFVADLKTTKQKLDRFNEIIDPESKLPKKTSQTSPEEDCLKVNPSGVNNLAYRMSPYMNCTMCLTAFELRRRGYDVMAKQKSTPEELALSMILMDRYFSGKTKRYESETYKEFLSDVKDIEKTSKNGYRGFVRFGHKTRSGGHVLNYEIQNGVMHLFDSQRGIHADVNTFFEDLAKMNNKTPSRYACDFWIVTNTQNLKPDYGAIRLLAIE